MGRQVAPGVEAGQLPGLRRTFALSRRLVVENLVGALSGLSIYGIARGLAWGVEWLNSLIPVKAAAPLLVFSEFLSWGGLAAAEPVNVNETPGT